MDPAISLDLSVNIFEDSVKKKRIVVAFQLDQFIIEYCNEILKSVTDLGLSYKMAFNFADLKPAKAPNKLNKKRGL